MIGPRGVGEPTKKKTDGGSEQACCDLGLGARWMQQSCRAWGFLEAVGGVRHLSLSCRGVSYLSVRVGVRGWGFLGLGVDLAAAFSWTLKEAPMPPPPVGVVGFGVQAKGKPT